MLTSSPSEKSLLARFVLFMVFLSVAGVHYVTGGPYPSFPDTHYNRTGDAGTQIPSFSGEKRNSFIPLQKPHLFFDHSAPPATGRFRDKVQPVCFLRFFKAR